jgi:diguanylate cyclase (GGDEF)-like protein
VKALLASISLRAKLGLVTVLALLLTAASTCSLAVLSYYQEAEARLASSAAERARLTARQISAALLGSEERAAQRVLDGLRLTPEVLYGRILDGQGRQIAHYRNPAWRELPVEFDGPVMSGQRVQPGYLESIEPIFVNGSPVGTLLIGTDLAYFRYDLVGFGIKVILVTVVTVLLAVLLIGRMQRALLAPLTGLAEFLARVIGQRRYDLRNHTAVRDEVGTLSDGINDLLQRISDRDASLHKELAERSESQRRLEELAHFDPLTKLPNRHFFSRQLERTLADAVRSGSAGAVLLIDLNGFSRVNEAFGHDAGDTLLVQVARRIVTRLREGDMLCRLGSDDFALILEQVSGESHILAVVTKIMAAVTEPVPLGEREAHVSARIGIAVFPVDGAEPHEVLRNAEAALVRAKKTSEPTHCFYAPDMRDRTHPRLNVEFELQRALERRELRLYFQPQVALADDEVRGLEALVRWEHPERGILMPGDFIPIAEENANLVRAISDWTVEAACAQIAAWRAEGRVTVPVAVNFTPSQFRDSRIALRLEEVLRKHGVPAEALELEIPENLLMAEPRAGETLVELRQLGLRIALDDFGTGYSSLAYLRELPINALKIDRGFVHGLPDSAKYSSIVRAIVSLAGHLGFDTIAEGVERNRQVEMLRAMGCTAYQGFCFSAAVPAQEAVQFLGIAQPALRRLAVA